MSGEIVVRSGCKLFRDQVRKLEPASAGDGRKLDFDISINMGGNVDVDADVDAGVNTDAGIGAGIDVNDCAKGNSNVDFNNSTESGANVDADAGANTSSSSGISLSSNSGTSLSTSNCASVNPDIIQVDFDTDVFVFNKKIAVFFKSHGDVQTEKTTEDSCNVLTAHNGLLSIKASPDFSHSLYSLKYKDNEWFDSSFPVPGIKA